MGEGNLTQRRDDVGEEIGRHEDIGVADDEQVVFRQAFELHEFGYLRIRAGQGSAYDELRVAAGELLHELADDPANRVVGCGHAEEDLRGAAVLLGEPASQAVLGGRIAPFERLEQRQGRLSVEGGGRGGRGERRLTAAATRIGGRGGRGHALVQGEAPGDQPLPERQGEAQQGEGAENQVQDHCWFRLVVVRAIVIELAPGRKRKSEIRLWARQKGRRGASWLLTDGADRY